MVLVRKGLFLFFISLIVTGLYLGAFADHTAVASGKLYKKDHVKVLIDGKQLETESAIYIKDGHILLPMREFYENMNASVYWNQKTREVTSLKNNKKIVLKIDSNVAMINGEKKILKVPALIQDNRTYIPLRFVGESLGSKVQWVPTSQMVKVETPKEERFILHINNEKVEMDTPPIIKQGRMYIAAQYFLNYLDRTDAIWKDEHTFEILIDGLSFIFTNGESSITVDNEAVSTDLNPFKVDDQMFLPVHFIVQTLGGNTIYKGDTKELYVDLNRYIFNSEFLEKKEEKMSRPQLIPSAKLSGERRLLVSDNPEQLDIDSVPTPTATLAEDTVKELLTSKDHRVFGWNVNKMNKTIKIGITIENLSDDNPLLVESAKGYVRKSNKGWINYDIGLPIADALLSNKMQPSLDTPLKIQPGETLLIDEFEVDHGYVIGFVEDLTISSIKPSKQAQYKIRTVMGQSVNDLTQVHSNSVPVNLDAKHPRGVWSASELEATLPVYSVGSNQVSYSLSNGNTDHLLTEHSVIDPSKAVIPNPGHFGMKYNLQIPVKNETGQTKKIRIRAAARGGAYSGAIKINGQVKLIPTLQPLTQYVTILEKDIEKNQENIDIQLIHAGGSALPIAFYIDTIQ